MEISKDNCEATEREILEIIKPIFTSETTEKKKKEFVSRFLELIRLMKFYETYVSELWHE